MTFMSDVIRLLDTEVKDYRKKHPGIGLPEDLFNCVTRMTPIMNVDLLLELRKRRSTFIMGVILVTQLNKSSGRPTSGLALR